MAAQCYGVLTISYNFVSSTNFLRVLSALLSKSLMKMLTCTISTSAIIFSYGMPLLMGLQLDFMPSITTLWDKQFRQLSMHLSVYLSVCQSGC